MNVFISFSGSAREEFALKFLNFFNKYGLHGWYDQHELFLGDVLKKTIICDGIDRANYCILIINKTYLSRKWPCEEAQLLYQKSKEQDNHIVFPILLDLSKEELKASNLDFLLEIKYQFLYTGDEIDSIGFQILNRIFHDIASRECLPNLQLATSFFARLTQSTNIDIFNALAILNNFDETNYRYKSVFLICLIRLFNNNPYEKLIMEMSYFLYDTKHITFDMYKIIESVFLICASLFSQPQ